MRTLMSWGLMVTMFATSVGCTPIRTKTPLATCPLAQKVAHQDNGTIFQSTAVRPLFEDRHARNVGDELNVTIGEETTPTAKASGNAAKPGSVNATLPSVKDGTLPDTNGNNAFSGTMIVTVIGVLANGKLVVCGDKLVKYANADENFEYVRFSGIVNPGLISSSNTISSSKIADVQIEYRTANGEEGSHTFFSRLDRFFLPKQLYF